MNKEFYAGNRKSLYQKLEAGSLVVVFSGHAPIKTNDENYPFFTNRNFLYLTGIDQMRDYMNHFGKQRKLPIHLHYMF